MSLCNECNPKNSLSADEECDRCGKNARKAHLEEELDLEGRPSQVLVVDAGEDSSHHEAKLVRQIMQRIVEESGLEKDERKQVAIFSGDLEFETLELED